MFRHPATWFVLGIAATWGYHHFVKPLPAAAS